MKIPLEHFNNTPVFALSPTNNGAKSEDSGSMEAKTPCPLSNTVGSAPNSPGVAKKLNQPAAPTSSDYDVPTISGQLNGPVSLPPSAFAANKYATLPTK